MRLSADALHILHSALPRLFGADAAVYLFGSRVNDAARGGDVDLFVETPRMVDYHERAAALVAMEDAFTCRWICW